MEKKQLISQLEQTLQMDIQQSRSSAFELVKELTRYVRKFEEHLGSADDAVVNLNELGFLKATVDQFIRGQQFDEANISEKRFALRCLKKIEGE
jgi:hypothetical protein